MVSHFEFTDYTRADEILVLAEIKLATVHINATGNNVYMLAGFVIMQNVTTQVSLTKPNPRHVIVSERHPLGR